MCTCSLRSFPLLRRSRRGAVAPGPRDAAGAPPRGGRGIDLVRLGGLVAILFAAWSSAGCERDVAGGQADGAAIYREVCVRCHGPGGTPSDTMARTLGVRDLADASFQDGISGDEMRARIRNGSENRRMPAFEGVLTPDQIDAVATHVRSLAQP